MLDSIRVVEFAPYALIWIRAAFCVSLIINRISAFCLHDVRFTFEEKKCQFKETNEDLLLLNIYFNEKKVHLDEQGEEKSELTLP